jgi:hypothetical protein
MAASEVGVLASQCLDRRIADKQILTWTTITWTTKTSSNSKIVYGLTTGYARQSSLAELDSWNNSGSQRYCGD